MGDLVGRAVYVEGDESPEDDVEYTHPRTGKTHTIKAGSTWTGPFDAAPAGAIEGKVVETPPGPTGSKAVVVPPVETK